MPEATRSDHDSLAARAWRGAWMGALFGTGLLGIGVMRFLGAKMAEAPIEPLQADDSYLAALYVLGFTVAGSVLSMLWGWRRSTVGAFALGYLAAAIVSTLIGVKSLPL